MSNFHDVLFPLRLAFGASGGPMRVTEITPLASGAEHRNTPHAHSRRRYNAAAGIKSVADFETLIAFFEARMGQFYGFRFRDPLDHASCPIGQSPSSQDQFLGDGDGARTDFGLVKNYSDAAGGYQRPIARPREGSLLIALGGAEQSASDFTFENGKISFVNPPAAGVSITAGYEFDVPVRFDIDRLDIALEAFGAGELTTIPLIEISGHE